MAGLSQERQGLEFKREIDVAQEIVRQLKKEGADFIIALTHMGLEGEPADPPIIEGDRALTRSVPDIDPEFAIGTPASFFVIPAKAGI